MSVTYFVQMPKEEYDALKAKAEATDKKCRELVTAGYEAVFANLEEYRNTRVPDLIAFLRANRERFIKTQIDKLNP